MSECFCDYDMPTAYSKTEPIARKVHPCSECGRQIQPGEKCERVFGVWDGSASTFKTCARCASLREWVQAHVPCFCWAHGNIIDDAIETARYYSLEAPGFLFGAYRRQVAIWRAPRFNRLETPNAE